jgi:hypothetical protein
VRHSIRAAIFAAVLAAIATPGVSAQGIVISPHYIFLSDRDKSTTIDLFNSGNVISDIAIGTVFGTYRTDSVGGIVVVPDSNPPSDAPSAAKWIEAYPKHLVLRPSEHQSIKILVVEPANLADGEYRTRLVVSSRSLLPPRTTSPSALTTIQLNVDIQTSLSLIYRKGTVSTSVKIANVRATVNGDYLDVRMHLAKEGNGSFFGKVRGGLVDRNGRVVSPLDVSLGMNESMDPRFRIPLGVIRSGTYSLRLNISSDRTDIPPEALLIIPRERWEGAITVQRGY